MLDSRTTRQKYKVVVSYSVIRTTIYTIHALDESDAQTKAWGRLEKRYEGQNISIGDTDVDVA